MLQKLRVLHHEKDMVRAEALVCSRCHLAFYCSKECQRLYHTQHVKWCKHEASKQADLRAEHPASLVLSSRLRMNLFDWRSNHKDPNAKGSKKGKVYTAETCPDVRYCFNRTCRDDRFANFTSAV